MKEKINHPSHYQSKYETIDVIEGLEWGQGFNRGNALKYLMRAGKKSPETEIEDLKKARWYLDREINRLESLDNIKISFNAIDKSDKDEMYANLMHCYECAAIQPCVGCPYNGLKLEILKFIKKNN